MSDQNFQDDLSFDDFCHRLKQEYAYHKNGGTEYRQRTAKLSLKVAMEVSRVNPFLTLLNSQRLVANQLPSLDIHRKNDVAKMLYMLAKNMHLEHTTPPEVKDYVNNKMKSNMILKKL